MALQANRAVELAAQYQAGDRKAMEDLIQEIQDSVYYHCVKILRNESDAQDAAQDVLMAVLRGLDGLKNPAAFHSWLNQIIARTCMKTYAREHREISMSESGEDPFFDNPDDQRIPEKIIDTEETRRMIRELVDELPPAQRLCVLMYYYDELPVKDIAEAVGAPENTVKSRLSYARKAIKAGVDRWIAQGLTLCSFTPLPYLRYFLQKESDDCRLPPLIATRIQEALLAAGAAGAAAAGSAGGGTLTGAAAEGAAAAGLVHKGALALAGLLLAGGVGGMLLHNPAQQPDGFPEPDPPQITETFRTPAETGAPEYLPETEPPQLLEANPTPAEAGALWYLSEAAPPPDAPAPYTEQRAADIPAPPPAGETPGDTDGGSDPTALPGQGTGPEPEAGPAPGPGPETAPGRNPSSGSDSGFGSDADTGSGFMPDPVPDENAGSEPAPGPDPTPTPPDPDAPADDFYRPNYDFGTYLGRNEDGVYEFDIHLLANRESPWLYPLEDGHYYTRSEISDELRVGRLADYIYGQVPGTCEVRYYVSRTPEGPYELKVIAYVTVEPEEPITPDYDWGGYEGMGDTVAHFSRTFVKGDSEAKSPLRPGHFYLKSESENPDVVEVINDTELRAVGAGDATVGYYTRWAEGDPWVKAAVVDVTVLDETPPEPEVAERQTLRAGYGYNESFFNVWQGELPETMHFTSSKPSVVYIEPSGGGFSALSPGTAELTAYDPLRPELLYVLEVQVDSAFAWEYTAEDMTLSVGESQAREIEYTVQSINEVHMSSLSINSASPYVTAVTVEPDSAANDRIRFEIAGLAPGTAEIEGKAVFEVLTYDVLRSMEAAFSFQVQVDEPPEADIPTVSQELEQFGYCSGYGYNGYFSSIWDGELPEDLTYISSDPAVAYIVEGGEFSTLSAGTAVLTATSAANPACRYELTLHVEDRFDCVRTVKETKAYLDGTNSTAWAPNYQDYNGRLKEIKWTSSDPEMLSVIWGDTEVCSYRAYREGKAALIGTAAFEVSTVAGTRDMYDVFSIPVTTDYSIKTDAIEAESFGHCSGYGYTGSFRDYFPDLPEGMYFTSSNSNVSVHPFDGRFTTLKPGRVLLLAYENSYPITHQYAVWLDIQDTMDWTYSLEGMTLAAGSSGVNGVKNAQLNDGVTLRAAYWSADSYLVSVTRDADDPLLCRVTAKQIGDTTVTGILTFQVPYYNYDSVSTKNLTVIVTFPVSVRLPQQIKSDTSAEIRQ